MLFGIVYALKKKISEKIYEYFLNFTKVLTLQILLKELVNQYFFTVAIYLEKRNSSSLAF